MQSALIRIGTRDSKLAMWQALHVQSLLNLQGISSELVPVKSEGDLDLVTPLYAMGVQGVFTKTLDAFLLSNKIDMAVHSMKDVPTFLAKGLCQGAVLARASYSDLFVYKQEAIFEKYFHSDEQQRLLLQGIVATGSVRRTAQLLHRFPKLRVENLRGNVQTRMRKLHDNPWDGAIFAAAGLERIDERPKMAVELDWMLPAPAQGVIMISVRQDDNKMMDALIGLNDPLTALCVKVERDFLSVLMGGCSAPIGALAKIQDGVLNFSGNVLSTDGVQIYEINKSAPVESAFEIGRLAAQQLLNKGAGKLIEAIRQ